MLVPPQECDEAMNTCATAPQERSCILPHLVLVYQSMSITLTCVRPAFSATSKHSAAARVASRAALHLLRGFRKGRQC